MQFIKIQLPQGETVNARAYEQDIVLYISKNNAVYKGLIKNYADSPELQDANLMVYCDEVTGLDSGGYIERRGENLRIII